MKKKILKLAKRLNKFTIDEIVLILGIDENEIETILSDSENIKKSAEIYLYVPTEKTTPFQNMFMPKLQNHTHEKLDIIIKCFCLNIETIKVAKLSGFCQDTISEFYKKFRIILYKKQLQELESYYQRSLQIPRQRKFFNKIIFFYVYDSQVFVSDKKLSAEVEKSYTDDEVKLMKTCFSRIRRKFLKAKHETNLNLFVAENIWRDGKTYEQLLTEIYDLANLTYTKDA